MKEFWEARNKRERWLIIMAVLSIVTSVPFMFTPTSGLTKALLPANVARQKYQQAVEQTTEMIQDGKRMRHKLSEWTFHSNPDALIPQLIDTLQKQSVKGGVHLMEIRPLRTIQNDKLAMIPISIRCECPFDKAIAFLYYLEDPSSKMVVDRVDISSSGTNSNLVDMNAQIATYTQTQ
jgi:Tfp pilus assembly protein PilO